MNARTWLVISALLFSLALFVHFRGQNSDNSSAPAVSVNSASATPAASATEQTTTDLPSASVPVVTAATTTTAAKPLSKTPAAAETVDNPDLDQDALYEELSQINTRMAHDLAGTDDESVAVEAESDLIGFQTELMKTATTSPREAEFAVGLLDKCGRDSNLLEDVRMICAGNLKRLAMVFPEKVESRYQDLLQSLPANAADELREINAGNGRRDDNPIQIQ